MDILIALVVGMCLGCLLWFVANRYVFSSLDNQRRNAVSQLEGKIDASDDQWSDFVEFVNSLNVARSGLDKNPYEDCNDRVQYRTVCANDIWRRSGVASTSSEASTYPHGSDD